MDDFIETVPPLPIASPCINVCEIDHATRRCRGCARTLDEIARWSSATPEWRAAVMAALPARASGGIGRR